MKKTMIVEEGKRELLAWKSEKKDFEYGTVLTVRESQQAVFFSGGKAVRVLGPGTHTLETDNLPFLQAIQKWRYGQNFSCEVYYVNHAVHMALPWGMSERVNAMIEVEPGKKLPLSIGVSGTMNIQVDPDQVIKFLEYVVGTGKEFNSSSIRETFSGCMSVEVKKHLSEALQEQNVIVFELDRYLGDISKVLKQRLTPEFENYGLILREFYVTALALPDEDPIYQDAKRLYLKRYVRMTTQDIDIQAKLQDAKNKVVLANLEHQAGNIHAQAGADATVITARGEQARRGMEGITSIEEHKFRTIEHMADASANSGNGAAGGGMNAGNMAGFMEGALQMGVGLQMAQAASGIMKDAMSSGADAGSAIMGNVSNGAAGGAIMGNVSGGAAGGAILGNVSGSAAGGNGEGGQWICGCGCKNPADNRFCGSCGAKRVQEPREWICSCGRHNPQENRFCGSCGAKRVQEPREWVCGCGHKNPADNRFCGFCGAPEENR